MKKSFLRMMILVVMVASATSCSATNVVKKPAFKIEKVKGAKVSKKRCKDCVVFKQNKADKKIAKRKAKYQN